MANGTPYLFIDSVVNDLRPGYMALADYRMNGLLDACPTCPACGEPMGLRREIPPPRIRLRGDRLGDIVFSIAGGTMFLSRRFVDEWQAMGFTGMWVAPSPVELICSKKLRESFSRLGDVEFYFCRVPTSIVQTAEAATVSYYERPPCDVCRCGRRPRAVERLVLEGADLPDIVAPSCVSPWTALSPRACAMVDRCRFVNVPLCEGFTHADELRITLHNHRRFEPSGDLVCSETLSG